ncbi:MAG: hypothetical protein WC830_06475 [Burkholderiales bacterium]
MSDDYGIWSPYQAFYIESMLTVTSSAVESAERLGRIVAPEADLEGITEDDILNWVQNIIAQAAALSRYFWTSKPKEKSHRERSQYLRNMFDVKESSVLKDRSLRNLIEYFDENLDTFLARPVVGTVVPNLVGVDPENDGVPRHVFRAFYNRIGVFEVLGHRYEVQPIVDEIYEVHRRLLSFAERGYVMRMSEEIAHNKPLEPTLQSGAAQR